MKIVNYTVYHDADLRSFFAAGLRAMKVPAKKIAKTVIIILHSKVNETRACAEVGGTRVAVEMAPPSRFSMRRFCRVVEHEFAHLNGVTHEQMSERQYWCKGGIPAWAVDMTIRYRGRGVVKTKRAAKKTSRKIRTTKSKKSRRLS